MPSLFASFLCGFSFVLVKLMFNFFSCVIHTPAKLISASVVAHERFKEYVYKYENMLTKVFAVAFGVLLNRLVLWGR